MKLLDWFYRFYFKATMNNGSRDERAVFLLWLLLSFMYVSIFYLILILARLQIHKEVFLPIWVLIFFINYLILRRIYIQNKRSMKVVHHKENNSKFYNMIRTGFSIILVFLTVIMAIICTFYYGKNVNFLY